MNVLRLRPQVNPKYLRIENIFLMALPHLSLICIPQFNLESRVRPRYLVDSEGKILDPCNLSSNLHSCAALFLLNTMKVDFKGLISNISSFRASITVVHADCSLARATSGNLWLHTIVKSSSNAIILVSGRRLSSKTSFMSNSHRTGDRTPPEENQSRYYEYVQNHHF